MVTKIQECIYNTYLKYSRFGKPVQYRKDFNNLEPEVKYLLVKLENFFQKYSHLKIQDYFEAPVKLYPDEKYPYLDFFTTRAAIKTYSLYKNLKEEDNPENQFEEIKESLKFIGLFCLKNKIKLDNYLTFKGGYTHDWLNHYREHKINLYSLMELKDVDNLIGNISEEENEIFSNILSKKVETFKVRYHNSNKTKQFVKIVTDKVENFIKNELHKK